MSQYYITPLERKLAELLSLLLKVCLTLLEQQYTRTDQDLFAYHHVLQYLPTQCKDDNAIINGRKQF